MSHIVAKDVIVEFPIYDGTSRSLKSTVLNTTTGGIFARDAQDRLVVRALDGINLDLKQGDRLGLIGHNGSGKTTLLRTLTGTYEPVGGTLHVAGRVASLLDISLGLEHDAPGYENIMTRGILMGMSKREIDKKMDDIAEFSELGDYLNMPLRTYSSGMKMRLAFSVATCMNADILVMDEWLSTGDAEFNKKATVRLRELVDKASILIFASHDMKMLGDLCNRAIRLEHGKIVEEVNPKTLLSK